MATEIITDVTETKEEEFKQLNIPLHNADEFEKYVTSRVQNLFGFITKYLPQDLKLITEWQKNLLKPLATKDDDVKTAADHDEVFNPIRLEKIVSGCDGSIQECGRLIIANGTVRRFVIGMINQVPKRFRVINNVYELLYALNKIINMAPSYNVKHKGFFPMSSLFVYMMYTRAGEMLFVMNEWNCILQKILQQWCEYLDSNESTNVLNESDSGWFCKSAIEYNKLHEYIYDPSMRHYGFISFNDYFHRQINPLKRPLSGKNNNKIIVSANDGTVYDIANNVQLYDKFWIKQQPYSLINILNHNEYTNKFINGTLFQTFLSGADYHRFRSPIRGIIKHVEIINGLYFSELHSQGFDPSAGTKSQGYEVSVNTRGLIIIESVHNKNIGMICVIPVGITEISSITINVEKNQVVEKGQELGYFSYGGSTIALIFQKKCINKFTVEQNQIVQVKHQIAISN